MTTGLNFKRSFGLRASIIIMLSLLVVGASGSSVIWNVGYPVPADRLAGMPSASDEAAETGVVVAFLEERLRRDPGDAVVNAKLAGLYLAQLRETGALQDLGLAERAARRSLAIVPAVRNTDGLSSLAQAQFAAHQFRLARDNARELIKIEDSAVAYALLGDALAELGRYSEAERAYAQMRLRSHAGDENVATRSARWSQLHGDSAGAAREFSKALAFELERSNPSRERIAWFYWQLGDTAFFTGDNQTAQRNYDAALAAYPRYFRALASLGRVRAARDDFAGAIAAYEAAVRILPDPTFVAELGDLYKLSGQQHAAQTQYDLVEFIGHLSRLNGVMYNRQIATFYADHDFKTQEAYRDAQREFVVRQDILGADSVAWTALKAGKVRQARTAIKWALRLGTQDPRLLYHAGMIARAAGDRTASRRYLQRALALNPRFDPLQAIAARSALTESQQ